LIEKEMTYAVVGCATAVLNELEHGLREKTYERAFSVEFRHQAIRFEQQHAYPIYYRSEHIGQVLNYLKITGL
jgi:GxxExxY protein